MSVSFSPTLFIFPLLENNVSLRQYLIYILRYALRQAKHQLISNKKTTPKKKKMLKKTIDSNKKLK